SAPESGGGPQAALETLIRERRGVPNGSAIFLKAARIHAARPDLLILEIPPGPGLEKLSDAAARATLEKALRDELGGPLRLEVRAPGADTDGSAPPRLERLTPERVKSSLLARLAREEPVLGTAIETWDLELLD